jgi:uncharacterized protein YcfL
MKNLFLAAVLGLLVAGCDTQTVLGPNDTYSTTNDAGQHVESIKKDDLRTWLADHKKRKIVTMTSVDRGSEGATSEFIIVSVDQ